MSPGPSHEIWVDVGGTFTDCIHHAPGGALRLHKLLSSGVYRGRVGEGSTSKRIIDAARAADPPNFFAGWRLVLFPPDPSGNREGAGAISAPSHGAESESSVAVAHFTHDGIELARALRYAPQTGQTYELQCPLEAPLIGARWLLGRGLHESLDDVDLRLGTTRGTNALLQQRGAKTAFITTRGFADVLRIGTQARPRLFDLHIRKPADLYVASVEIEERVDARGTILQPARAEQIRAALEPLAAQGVQSLAVCLLNAYRNPAHEQLIESIARQLGFRHVSLSTALAPLQRIVPRGQTTVIDAYLAPLIADYAANLQRGLGEGRLRLMSSAGALLSASTFRARDSVLSGPAGGVVAVAEVARTLGLPRAIGFDMGGTSTDVCRFDGQFERRTEMDIEDRATGGMLKIVAPLLSIETVAAGGGSVCEFDGRKLTVGPRSAGADPGPASYGRGGPLCITDVNLLLGRIVSERFPFPLSRAAAEARLAEIATRMTDAGLAPRSTEELAAGFIDIANAHMAAAIRKVSVQRGYDPRDYALVCFGGAGGQHACAIARQLGVRTIVVHPLASAMSALGIGRALRTAHAAHDLSAFLNADGLARVGECASRLGESLSEQLQREGVPAANRPPARLSLDLRYQGQDTPLSVEHPPDGDWQDAFEAAHQRLFGFLFPNRAIEICAVRMEQSEHATHTLAAPPAVEESVASTASVCDVWLHGRWQRVSYFEREQLPPGSTLSGPALVVDRTSVLFVEAGWRLQVAAGGELIATEVISSAPTTNLSAVQAQAHQSDEKASPADPVQLELFSHAFMSIAEQMGATLQRTSLSTNVKERLDFSCAVCDADGQLVAHAPHIPVHLGAMSHAVRCVMEDLAARGDRPRPGDVFVTNDPYRGGSHLPDVTVVTPVFDNPGQRILYFVANRAHHAEIGGIVPGSMPPTSRTLADEGALIRTLRLTLRAGEGGATGARFDDGELRRVLLSGPHPTRAVEQNLADIAAQIAANGLGTRLLNELTRSHGAARVAAYMAHLQSNAELQTLAALSRLREKAGVHRLAFEDALDDGSLIRVSITINGDEAVFDFTGSGDVHSGNLNATPAIVSSAVLYCLRCLIAQEVPLNAGVLRPVKLVIPPGLLNPPRHDDPARCPAVVGGNVETSQRIVDCIFGALGLIAAGQGTMNNFAFGDDRFGYYETIGGGAGAGPGFDGADAVHIHMTNTRLTDPEVIEDRYPVRLQEFSIRCGSGGSGANSGGNGIIRDLAFLKPLQISLLTQRRRRPPFGLQGGAAGALGRNLLIRAGVAEELDWAAHVQIQRGDRIRIETPGGGGWGNSLKCPVI